MGYNQGINNPGYVHGLWVKEQEWKRAVYTRDNYTCQSCFGERGCTVLNAHHIKSREERPDLIFDVDNGITYCASCHTSWHDTENNPMKGKHLTEEHKRQISIVHTGKIVSEETRRKISENNVGFKGKRHSDESREKMSLALKGQNNPMYGRKRIMSEDTKQKMRESRIAYLKRRNEHRG